MSYWPLWTALCISVRENVTLSSTLITLDWSSSHARLTLCIHTYAHTYTYNPYTESCHVCCVECDSVVYLFDMCNVVCSSGARLRETYSYPEPPGSREKEGARERKRERECVCVCVCMCVWERERFLIMYMTGSVSGYLSVRESYTVAREWLRNATVSRIHQAEVIQSIFGMIKKNANSDSELSVFQSLGYEMVMRVFKEHNG